MLKIILLSILLTFGHSLFGQSPSGIKNAEHIVLGEFISKTDTTVYSGLPPLRIFFIKVYEFPKTTEYTYKIYTFKVDSVAKGNLQKNQVIKILGEFEVDSNHTFDTQTRMLLLAGPQSFFTNDNRKYYWFYSRYPYQQPKSKKTRIPKRRVEYYLDED